MQLTRTRRNVTAVSTSLDARQIRRILAAEVARRAELDLDAPQISIGKVEVRVDQYGPRAEVELLIDHDEEAATKRPIGYALPAAANA